MSWWLLCIPPVAVVLLLVYRYGRGFAALRSSLAKLARGDTNIPLMLDLPGALRAAELDIRTISTHIGELERSALDGQSGLNAILAGIAEGVFIVNPNMTIRVANPAAQAMAAANTPLSGRTVVEAFGSASMHNLVQQGLTQRRAHGAEVVLDRHGVRTVCELGVSPLEPAAGQSGAVVVMRDITRIRTLERTRQEFVANVSHELRTPLTIINGYLETLADGGIHDPELAGTALEVMSKHAGRLKRLVDDLLVVSESESRTTPRNLTRFDLRDLLARVVDQLAEPIRTQGAAVRVISDGDLTLEADAAGLEQVFVNLLENALKHGNRRGLAIELRAERHGSEIHVDISDNGVGIPYDDQQHVFERFYRVHKHRSRETGGTGLGLAIVKNIVQSHGGRISLTSTPGSGSNFHIILPVRPATTD